MRTVTAIGGLPTISLVDISLEIEESYSLAIAIFFAATISATDYTLVSI